MVALASDIIQRTKRLISMPSDDTLFDQQDYVNFINECLVEKVYPRVMKIRDDYFLVREVFNLTGSNGLNLYPLGVIPIPPRAWGNTLREIKYIDVSGNFYKVNPYFLEDLDLYQSRNLAFSASYQKGFIPFNNGIKLVPPPLNDQGSIEMHYIISPSTVIYDDFGAGGNYLQIYDMTFDSLTNIATIITTKITGNGEFVGVPINSSAIIDLYDSSTGMLIANDFVVIRQNNTIIDGQEYSVFTGVCTVQNGTGWIVPNVTEMTNFQAGGYPVNSPYYASIYMMVSGVTPFTPLPKVLDNLLVYELAIKILSAQGYLEELQIFLKEHEDLRKDLLSQMAMRVECEPYVISNKRGVRSSVLFGATRNKRRI